VLVVWECQTVSRESLRTRLNAWFTARESSVANLVGLQASRNHAPQRLRNGMTGYEQGSTRA